MIHEDLKLKHVCSIETDLIFEGYWKGEWFQALFVSGEHDYGWHNMTFLRQFSKEDEGVFNDKNVEYDDIAEALADVDVLVNMMIDIK